MAPNPASEKLAKEQELSDIPSTPFIFFLNRVEQSAVLPRSSLQTLSPLLSRWQFVAPSTMKVSTPAEVVLRKPKLFALPIRGPANERVLMSLKVYLISTIHMIFAY